MPAYIPWLCKYCTIILTWLSNRSMSCSLPWRKNTSKPACPEDTKFSQYDALARDLTEMNEIQLAETTGCIPSCNRARFTASNMWYVT